MNTKLLSTIIFCCVAGSIYGAKDTCLNVENPSPSTLSTITNDDDIQIIQTVNSKKTKDIVNHTKYENNLLHDQNIFTPHPNKQIIKKKNYEAPKIDRKNALRFTPVPETSLNNHTNASPLCYYHHQQQQTGISPLHNIHQNIIFTHQNSKYRTPSIHYNNNNNFNQLQVKNHHIQQFNHNNSLHINQNSGNLKPIIHDNNHHNNRFNNNINPFSSNNIHRNITPSPQHSNYLTPTIHDNSHHNNRFNYSPVNNHNIRQLNNNHVHHNTMIHHQNNRYISPINHLKNTFSKFAATQ